MISIQNLEVIFRTNYGDVQAVRGVDFSFEKGQVIGIAGESGCGKSTSMLALTGILPKNAKISYQSCFYDHQKVHNLSLLRGKNLAYIFQDPQSSLNPVIKISDQIEEALKIKHPDWNMKQRKTELVRLLDVVKIRNPRSWLSAYPHQLSGGMKQRIMIAMALAFEPDILIADEPTTSLDVTIQSDILKLLMKIKEDRGMGIVLITHDLNLARKVCDQIYIMYLGSVVERGSTEQVIENPKHPYTRLLVDSVPEFESEIHRFTEIPGQVPDIRKKFTGCSFANRCPVVKERCRNEEPPLETTKNGHSFACFYPVQGLSES